MLGSELRLRAGWSILPFLLLPVALASAQNLSGDSGGAALRVQVDVSRRLGAIRSLQGVDNGPLCARGVIDLTRYYQAIGIDWIRLNGVPWAYYDAADLNYLFPRWDAPADDPTSYAFAQTDFYLTTVLPLGAHLIYRLGYSAEYRTPIRHNAPPPSDEKFAEVAAHIVRHFNQGWANGRHDRITHWEVWNEADSHSFWAGTAEQYDRLYEVTARQLKRADPSLKVGGPALAQSLPFLEQFLSYCQRHHVPLDFVSWHTYTQDPNAVARRARRVREMMVQRGFGGSENILDEWNYGPDSWKSLFVDANATREYFEKTHSGFGAAFDVAVLTKLQDAPVDVAAYYSGTNLFWGLFTSAGVPERNYYGFLAFRRLLGSPSRVGLSPIADDAITAIAGVSKDEATVRILMTNRSKSDRALRLDLAKLPWTGPSACEIEVVSDRSALEKTGSVTVAPATTLSAELAAESVLLVTIRAETTPVLQAR